MKIIKPNWVKHEHKGNSLSIFSIDIHPDGTRFATGGQGNDCGRVAIWNLSAVITVEVENDENQPKLLCQIDSHLQCVNSVRWSHSGNYLASAGDDKLIMIWTLGGRYQGQTEQYRTVSTLRSHSGDILDLSWSHDDQFLASCSIDNMIVIWNAQRWPEITKILKGHCGLVKGVTWDPIGKYLASQSADKTLRVWRISDWSEEVCIREPFEQCGDTTHVLRVSWSPDGQYLVSAQAMNNCGSVAKIIDRQDWSFSKDFVGHRKAIPCASFNPNIFKCTATTKKKNQNDSSSNNNVESQNQKYKPQCVCALGSRDRSISIWSTARSRPLVVMDDVFGNSVIDLSWSRCGYHLLACSIDGGVICLQFDQKELGPVYTEEERVQFLQQLYGNSLFSNKNSIGNRLIEDMDILLLQQKSKQQTTEVAQNGGLPNAKQLTPLDENKNEIVITTSSLMKSSTQITTSTSAITTNINNNDKDSSSSLVQSKPPITILSTGRLAKGPTDKQIEIRSADGRRRIIPLFIPPTTDTTTSGSTNNSNNHSFSAASITTRPITFSSSSESKSKIVIETLDESNPGQNLREAYQYLNSNSLPDNSFSTTTLTKTAEYQQTQPKDSISTKMTLEQVATNLKAETELKSTNENISTMSSNQVTTTNGNQQQQKSSEDSSDDEIIIKRSKTLKRSTNKSSNSVSEPQIKRKPGRPPGSTSSLSGHQHLNKSNYVQQDSTLVTPVSANEVVLNTKNYAELASKVSGKSPSMVTTKQLNQATTISTTTTTTTTTINNENHMITNGRSHQVQNACTSATNFFFPPLRLPRQNHTSIRLFTKSDDGKTFSASIEYPLTSSGICKLAIFSGDHLCWNVMISDPILAVSGSEEIVACFCQDHSIQVFNTSNGRRLFVPIILESEVARMICANKSNLLLITSNARLWLWDFIIPRVLVRGESLAPLLIHPKTSEQLSIQSASVSSTSKPIVTVSNGRTYIFETDFQSWCLLNDLNDPLNSCTDLRPCAINSIKQLSSFTKFPSRSLLNFFSSNVPLAQQSALSFIEKQIEVSRLLGSVDDYRFWVLNLAQHLVSIHSAGGEIHAENVENRLKELCANLLGSRFPVGQRRLKMHDESNQQLSNHIVGLNKHELLREVLAMLTSNLSLQRLYLEYKDLLDSFSQLSGFSSSNPLPTTITEKNLTSTNCSNNNNHDETTATSSSPDKPKSQTDLEPS